MKKGRRRTSLIWTIDREKLESVVRESSSLADIMRHFGLVMSGASYKPLKNRLREDGIDFSHIPIGYGCNKGRKVPSKAIPLEEVMVRDSTYSRGSLKRRLLSDKILINECYICGQGPEWNGGPLTLVLDHINGVNNDNRLKNLRIVCPNCDRQLPTSTGRNRRKRKNCKVCGKVIGKKSTYCRSCVPIPNDTKHRKVLLEDRPSREELIVMVKEMSVVKIGKIYGVSDNSIRKWCRSYGINCKKQNPVPDAPCDKCGKMISGKTKTGMCIDCLRMDRRKVKDRPTVEQLLMEIDTTSTNAVARKYGVARTTINKWIKVGSR